MSNQEEVEVIEPPVTDEIKETLLNQMRKVRDIKDPWEFGPELQRAKSLCNITNSMCNLAKTEIMAAHYNELAEELGNRAIEIGYDSEESEEVDEEE